MKLSRTDIQVSQRLLNLIYPRRCPVCDGITRGYDTLVCTECRGRITFVGDPVCMRCGKPLINESPEYCADCTKRGHLYTRGAAAFVYDSMMKDSISRFKYHNRREYADFYAGELYASSRRLLLQWDADVLIPIPVHKSKRRRRGFNQAELIAERIGKLSGIPVRTDLLIRTKNTLPQKELGDEGRFENLKNAFQAGQNDVDYRKAVLVDDIYTTGSTVDAAASALLGAGVGKVYFLAVCIGSDA